MAAFSNLCSSLYPISTSYSNPPPSHPFTVLLLPPSHPSTPSLPSPSHSFTLSSLHPLIPSPPHSLHLHVNTSHTAHRKECLEMHEREMERAFQIQEYVPHLVDHLTSPSSHLPRTAVSSFPDSIPVDWDWAVHLKIHISHINLLFNKARLSS